jgi:hypothetical protein
MPSLIPPRQQLVGWSGADNLRYRFSIALRRPKRQLVVATAIVLFLVLGILFYGADNGSMEATSPTPEEVKLSQSPSPGGRFGYNSGPPLLGPEENPVALWYPFNGTAFKPQVATYNTYSGPEARPRTPLFIAFTRNHQLLEQTVLSYISTGWPREDIIVVDNSGTMDANNRRLLSQGNPFYLDHTLYRSTYGVSILQTPTLYTFSQLMNLYLRISMTQHWSIYFWSHQDVAVLSDETAVPYRSFYHRILDILADLGVKSLDSTQNTNRDQKWALKFFAYDWLTLINVEPWRTIGQWDPFIPYYTADCDAYSRITLHGFTKDDVNAGHVFDVSETVPVTSFFPSDPLEAPHSQRFRDLKDQLDALMKKKWHDKEASRNQWQGKENGGKGEAWAYDPTGFQTMWWETSQLGRTLYKKKWGTDECRLEDHGITLSDEFKTN